MGILSALRGPAAAICVLAAVSAAAAAQDTLEADVKATFLYNFTRFIEWPPEVATGSEPFRLCMVADVDMKRAIQRAVKGETVNGRPLVTTEPQTPHEAQQCQILFIGRSQAARGSRLLAAVRDLPVLTVGDGSRFVEQGGAIAFVRQEKNVRFDISLPSAQRSKLKISSNLLRVARNVVERDR